MARSEHVAEGRKYAVEALVFERERLGVGLHPFDLDTRLLCPSARVIEVLGGEVAPDDSCTAQRRRNRDRAATARADVEHVHPGLDAKAVEQPRAHVRDQVRGLVPVPSGPRRAVPFLDLGQIRHSAPLRSGRRRLYTRCAVVSRAMRQRGVTIRERNLPRRFCAGPPLRPADNNYALGLPTSSEPHDRTLG